MEITRSDMSRSGGFWKLAGCLLDLLVGGCALGPADRDGTADSGEALEPEAIGEVEQSLADQCGHSICETGAAVSATCDSCVESICDVDPFCCTTAWDSICVGEVSTVCGRGPVAVTGASVVSKI